MSEIVKIEDQELSEICATFLDLPDKYLFVSEDMIQAAERWKQKQIALMTEAGILASVDESSMERGAMIFLNMMMCQREIYKYGYMVETESGRKENPARPALRAYINQLEKCEGQHAAYPMSRHNKSMNLEDAGGQASHGNKKISDAAKLINGK